MIKKGVLKLLKIIPMWPPVNLHMYFESDISLLHSASAMILSMLSKV